MNFPEQIHLETTSRCNAKCRICPVGLGKMTRPHGNMDWDLFCKIIDECEGRKLDFHLSFCSEPLLDYFLFKRIAYIRQKCPESNMRLFTNGIFLDEIRLKELIATPVDVTISIDAASRQTYKNIKGVDKFDQVVRNAEAFVAQRHVTVHFVRTPLNQQEVEAFKAFWKGKAHVVVSEYDTWAGETPNFYNVDETNPDKICTSLTTNCAILWNGDICLCCRDFSGTMLFGNATKNSILEIWHSSKIEEYREQMRCKKYKGICIKCGVWRWQGYRA